MLPAMFAYAPIVLAMVPNDPRGYHWWRQSLAAAGAKHDVHRWIAWWGGVPAFLGLGALIATPFAIFLS